MADTDNRISAAIAAGASPYEAFEQCKADVVRMSRAHSHCIVLENFTNAVQLVSAGVPSLLQPLKNLCDLFACCRLRRRARPVLRR